MVRDRDSSWGGHIPRESPHFVQPDPRLALPARYWRQGACLEDPELRDLCKGEESLAADRLPVDLLCIQLARAFRARQLSGASVHAALTEFVENVQAAGPSPRVP
jgi:hypothetical protein